MKTLDFIKNLKWVDNDKNRKVIFTINGKMFDASQIQDTFLIGGEQVVEVELKERN